MKGQQDLPWTMAVTTLVAFVSFSSLPADVWGCTGMVIVRWWHTWALFSESLSLEAPRVTRWARVCCCTDRS